MGNDAIWSVSGTLPEIYESVFVPAVMRAWAIRLIDVANAAPGSRVLDVACGSGVVARLFAEGTDDIGRCVGYDASPEMLAIAQAMDPAGKIEWQQGDATGLPYPDGSFDIVACQHGLMFFQDQVASLREMTRVLAPGGQLIVLVWGAIERNPGFFAVVEGVRRYIGLEASDRIRGSFSMGDNQRMRALAGAAGLPHADIRQIAAQASFPSVESLVHGYGAMLQAVVDVDTRQKLMTDVAGFLESYVSDAGLAFPMEAIMMHSRK